MQKGTVLVFGSINVDLIAHADFSKQRDNYAVGTGFTTNSGGKGLNTAIGCAAIDPTRVHMLGRVGLDIYGDFIVKEAEQAGLSAAQIIRDSNAHTGIGHLRVAPDGEYDTVVVQGANDNLCGKDFDDYLSSHQTPQFVITNLETPISAIEHIANSRSAATLAINVSPMVDGAAAVLVLANLAVLNLSEAKTLLRTSQDLQPRELLFELRKISPSVIVITLGERGAIAIDEKNEIFEVSGIPVKAVNTVGAGDSFFATLVMALSSGATLAQSLEAGNQAGRLACLRSESHLTPADAQAIRLATGLNF